MYSNGQGVNRDYAKAVEWYTKSANQGHISAQNNLGVMYERGQGIPQDYSKAIEWYIKSANQGDEEAQYNLALMYQNGWGARQDHKKPLSGIQSPPIKDFQTLNTILG